MKKTLLLGLIIISSACASKWSQEGKSGIETRQDSAECANRILSERRELNETAVRECMEAKGYRLRTPANRSVETKPEAPEPIPPQGPGSIPAP